MKKNIILIGPRAVGKSKTSRLLAKQFKFHLLSTDSLAVYESKGLEIPQIVELKGWNYFRNLEFKILKKISPMTNTIIDTGGGIIVDLTKQNNEVFSKKKASILNSLGTIIYLRADFDWLWQKIENDPKRPSLSSTTHFKDLMQKRHIWYKQLSDFSINTTNLKADTIVKKILKKL